MHIELTNLKKRHEKKAVQFAIRGMHFNWYMNNKFVLSLYGRYFWYVETLRATQMIAAYADKQFVGVILAKINGEQKINNSFYRKCYVKLFDWIQSEFFEDSVGIYDEVNQQMYQSYFKNKQPDGEIIFFAVDPDCGIKGIGSKLLAELERREKGKMLFLYTDNACTYQFYEHRGFERVGEKNIFLDLGKKTIPLTCLLYCKSLI